MIRVEQYSPIQRHRAAEPSRGTRLCDCDDRRRGDGGRLDQHRAAACRIRRRGGGGSARLVRAAISPERISRMGGLRAAPRQGRLVRHSDDPSPRRPHTPCKPACIAVVGARRSSPLARLRHRYRRALRGEDRRPHGRAAPGPWREARRPSCGHAAQRARVRPRLLRRTAGRRHRRPDEPPAQVPRGRLLPRRLGCPAPARLGRLRRRGTGRCAAGRGRGGRRRCRRIRSSACVRPIRRGPGRPARGRHRGDSLHLGYDRSAERR